MRHSSLKHPVAILRTLTGESQKTFAERVGKSVGTIQSIELGRLALSDDLAEVISNETGADLEWLKNGDPTKPAIDTIGEPYTRETFEACQAERKSAMGRKGGDRMWTRLAVQTHLRAYAMATCAAMDSGKFKLFAYKATKAMESLIAEFGEVKSAIPDWPKADGMAIDDVIPVFEKHSAAIVERLFKEIDDRLQGQGGARSSARKPAGKSQTTSARRS